MVKLTTFGKEKVAHFIRNCEQKRKDILDAGLDTADETELPTEEDILSDTEIFMDEDGEYYNGWGVTDNYESDSLLGLTKGIDFLVVE